METNTALTKDEDGEDVDIYLYRSMIGSLIYLTSSRPDIMFSVCACSRFQVQLKVSHLNAVGLWYPKDSSFILEAFSNSDHAGASLDKKSTTGVVNFLVQVLWIQNQILDYGYNFMQTKIHVDNESAICVVKNPVYHSKIKHIEIRHHFIRDPYLRADEAVHKEGGDSVERAITTAASLDVAQDSDNITRTQTTTIPNVDILQGMDTGGSPRRQDTMGGGGLPVRTRSESVIEVNEPTLSQKVTHLEVGRAGWKINLN
ncbi:hypothetical protein Tco_0209090 [Tanacetum coccineum]